MPPDTTLDEITRHAHRELVQDHARNEKLDRRRIETCIADMAPLLAGDEVSAVAARVSKLLYGLGPLEPLLADPEITEVMVNGPERVWVERDGKLRSTDVRLDADTLRVIIDRIVSPLGLRVDRTSPFVDARLPDGSRVNVAVPPLAIDGPYVTIRRFRARPHELDDFCDDAVAEILVAAVECRDSMVISGGTGSGKTSLLNALASHIAPGERIVTIEDAAELRLPGEHTVRLEARPANAEGIGAIPIRALLRNALRMRPDRLVVGEVRGAEALDMIQAMNTGHDGSLSTCHANSPVDALRRIEAMALMGDVDLPVEVVRDHLRSAVDLVVHVERSAEGDRRVVAICRCTGSEIEWVLRDGRPVAEVAHG